MWWKNGFYHQLLSLQRDQKHLIWVMCEIWISQSCRLLPFRASIVSHSDMIKLSFIHVVDKVCKQTHKHRIHRVHCAQSVCRVELGHRCSRSTSSFWSAVPWQVDIQTPHNTLLAHRLDVILGICCHHGNAERHKSNKSLSEHLVLHQVRLDWMRKRLMRLEAREGFPTRGQRCFSHVRPDYWALM